MHQLAMKLDGKNPYADDENGNFRSQSSVTGSARQIMLENFASGKSYNRSDSVGQMKYHDRVKNTNPLLLSKADRIILDYQGQVPHYL